MVQGRGRVVFKLEQLLRAILLLMPAASCASPFVPGEGQAPNKFACLGQEGANTQN